MNSTYKGARRGAEFYPVPADWGAAVGRLPELLRLAKDGDTEALAALARLDRAIRTWAWARFARKLLGRLDPSDVAQEIWLDLLRMATDGPAHFGELTDPQRYLRGMIRNHVAGRWRHHRGKGRDVSLDESMADPITQKAAERAAAGRVPNPANVALADDLFAKATGDCTSNQREALALRRDGFTWEEIAAQTGQHERTVRRSVRPALARLAAALN